MGLFQPTRATILSWGDFHCIESITILKRAFVRPFPPRFPIPSVGASTERSPEQRGSPGLFAARPTALHFAPTFLWRI
jgi:hypothetical protein